MMAALIPPDPLAGLDEIDWASLQHAYGSAEDVPDLLRALRFHDERELDNVYFALYSNIFHQGTRYEATSYAVPFLYALLNAKDTPRREDLLFLIVSIALDHPSGLVPSGVEITKWRSRVAKTQQPNYAEDERRRKAEYIAAATSDKDRQRREDEFPFALSFEKFAERQQNGLRAYDAVRAGLDSVYRCLKDHNPDLRAVAAFCLAFFPEDNIKAEGELLALLGREDDIAVRGTALISIAILQAPSTGDLSQTEVAQYLKASFNNQDNDEASKWSSAIGLTILRIYEPETINKILQAITDDNYLSILQHNNCKRFPFADPDLPSLAATVLKVKGSEFPQVPRIALAQLEASKSQTTWYLTELLLESAFDGEPLSETMPFSELTELQQETLRALVRLDEYTWSWGNFTRILEKGGVPSGKKALDAYIDGKELETTVLS